MPPASLLPPEATARAAALAHYSTGLRDQMHQQYDSALSHFLAAVALDPTEDDLYLRAALEYLRRKEYGKAVAMIDDLCRAKPDEARPCLWLGVMCRAANQPDRAIRAYQDAIVRAPDRAEAYFELATLYVQLDRQAEAVQLLKGAVDLVTEPASLLQLLGDLYIQQADNTSARTEGAAARSAAIRTYERALETNPDDVMLLFQLGDLYVSDEQLGRAIEYFRRVETLEPDNLQVKKKLALSFAASGDQQAAVDMLEKIAKQQPANLKVYYYLGELYERLGDKEKAALNFRLATKAAGGDPAAYLRLALLQMEEAPLQAINTLRAGLQSIPDDQRLLESLAYFHMHQTNYTEAARYFDEAEKIMTAERTQPLTPAFYLNYCIAAQFAGRTAQATRILAREIDDQPALLEAYAQFIFLRADKHERAQAYRILDRVAHRQTNSPAVLIYLGLLDSMEEKYTNAVTRFETAEAMVKAGPAAADSKNTGPYLNANFYFWYGAALERLGRIDDAVLRFQQALELDPDHAEANNYLAYMWAERGLHLDKALRLIQRAISQEPDNPAYLDSLGWILFQLGRPDQALPHLRQAAETMPEDPTINEHLGDALERLGRIDDALEAWKQAFLADPRNEKIARKLADHGVNIEELRKATRRKQPAPTATPPPPAPEAPETPAPLPDGSVQAPAP